MGFRRWVLHTLVNFSAVTPCEQCGLSLRRFKTKYKVSNSSERCRNPVAFPSMWLYKAAIATFINKRNKTTEQRHDFHFFQWILYYTWGFQTWNSRRKIQQLKIRVKIKDNHSCLSQYEFLQACYKFLPCIAHLTAVVPPLACVLQKIRLHDMSKEQRITKRKPEQAKVTESV